RMLGTGALPPVVAIGPAGLDESSEGRLVSASGVVTTKPRRSSGGDLTIVLDRAGQASIKLIADASSQIAPATFELGATYQVMGVVGQRATHKDSPDGYRICLRDPGDLAEGLPGPAAAVSPGSNSAATSASNGELSARTVSIAQALQTLDNEVRIDA